MSKSPSIKILFAVLLVVAFLKIVVIALTINRGFDFGDEGGVYLLIPSHPYNTYHHSLFGVVTAFLHPGKEVTILGARLIKLIVDLIGLLILTWGAYRFSITQLNQNGSLFRFWVILLFAFLSFYIVPLCRTVSYNEYILLSVYGGFGFALMGYAEERMGFRSIFILLAGAFLSFGLLSKPQSAVLAIIIALPLPFLLQQNHGFKSKIKSTLILLSGFLTFISLFALAFGWSDFIAFHSASFRESQIIGYSPMNLMKLFITSDLVLVLHLILTLVSTMLLMFIANRIKIPKLHDTYHVVVIMVAGVFSIIYMLTLDFHPSVDNMRYKVLVLITPCVLAYVIYSLKHDWSWRKLWFIVVLLSLPVISIAGASSALIESLPQRYGSWFILCGILLTEGLLIKHLQRAYFFLASTLIVLLSYQFKKVLIDEPFMLNGSMWNQTFPMEIQNIKVDSATKAFIDKTVVILTSNGFQPGDTVLAQNVKNGIPYLLHASMPVCPMYTCAEESYNYNCFCLSHFLNDERLKFVLSADSLHPFNTKCLDHEEEWNKFSNRFILIGSAQNPLVPAYDCSSEKTYFFKLEQ